MRVDVNFGRNQVDIEVTQFTGYEEFLESLGFRYEAEEKAYIKRSIPYSEYHKIFETLIKKRETSPDIIILVENEDRPGEVFIY